MVGNATQHGSFENRQEKVSQRVAVGKISKRYPDEKFSFKRKCTKKFTKEYLDEIGVMKKWLSKQIKRLSL